MRKSKPHRLKLVLPGPRLCANHVTRGAAGIRGSTLLELRKYYDEGQIVKLTLVICTANFSNRFNAALENVSDIGE